MAKKLKFVEWTGCQDYWENIFECSIENESSIVFVPDTHDNERPVTYSKSSVVSLKIAAFSIM